MEPIVIITIALLAFMVLAFVAAIVATHVIQKRQNNQADLSLTNAGADSSDFSRNLTEAYKNIDQ